MQTRCYADAPFPVRPDLAEAHERAWIRIASPGTWLTGAERVAVLQEARAAMSCALCRVRKEALSPAAVEGRHETAGELPAVEVEAIHRIRTDPGRLTRRWLEGLLSDGLQESRYVEIVGVLAQSVAVDTFALGLGLAPAGPPAPRPGAPSRHRPQGLTRGKAWVALLEPGNTSGPEADLYSPKGAANIRQAMSQVPDEVRGFFELVGVQYLPGMKAMLDFDTEYRAITHPQIELLAARVSALNACVY